MARKYIYTLTALLALMLSTLISGCNSKEEQPVIDDTIKISAIVEQLSTRLTTDKENSLQYYFTEGDVIRIVARSNATADGCMCDFYYTIGSESPYTWAELIEALESIEDPAKGEATTYTFSAYYSISYEDLSQGSTSINVHKDVSNLSTIRSDLYTGVVAEAELLVAKAVTVQPYREIALNFKHVMSRLDIEISFEDDFFMSATDDTKIEFTFNFVSGLTVNTDLGELNLKAPSVDDLYKFTDKITVTPGTKNITQTIRFVPCLRSDEVPLLNMVINGVNLTVPYPTQYTNPQGETVPFTQFNPGERMGLELKVKGPQVYLESAQIIPWERGNDLGETIIATH